MIRVLLAEDQAMMRGALAVLLGLEDDIEVVAQVAAGAEVVAAARSTRPDVALLDIEMPGGSGLDAAAALRGAARVPRVIVTTFGRPGYLQRAMAAGAAGFLVKDGPVEGLADAIRQVAGGRTGRRPRAGRRARCGCRRSLTARERDVLAAAAAARRRRHRRAAAPLAEHRAQLPLRRHRQDRHPQQDRGSAARPSQRLALSGRSAGCQRCPERREEHRGALVVQEVGHHGGLDGAADGVPGAGGGVADGDVRIAEHPGGA